MPTLEDVARQAGVSKATVSRVLNNKPRVSEKTRNKVLEVARSLGCITRDGARALNRRLTYNLGAIFTANPYISDEELTGIKSPQLGWDQEALYGVEEAVREAGYNLFVTRARVCDPDGKLPRFVESRQVDGVFIIGGLFHDQYIERLKETGIPVVIIGSYVHSEDVNCIYADNFQGAYVATCHLLSLGHVRVAFINGPATTRTSADKLQGYRAALKQAGLMPDNRLIREGCFTRASGYSAFSQIWSDGIQPDAVFCANAEMAVGAIKFVEEQGLVVPDDIAIVGYQDEQVAAFTKPSLTCVRLYTREMGLEAGRRMLAVLNNGDSLGFKIAVPTKLIVRESSGVAR